MTFRTFALLIVAVAGPAAAKGAADELPAQLERRLTLLDGLRRSTPFSCRKLAELSQALPPSAVLSRVAFSRKTGRWELALSQGTKADAEAIVQRLVKKELCSTPVATLEGSAVTASCISPESPVELSLTAPKPRPVTPDRLRALRERQGEAQTILPDVPDLENYQRYAQDLAQKGLINGWSLTIGPAVSGPALDRFELSGSGSASFSGVAEFLCSLENARRLTSVDSFELSQPRVRNGEWVVDFSVTGTTWRHRREDEQKDLVVVLQRAHVPKLEAVDVLRTRSPFGPLALVFAGATRVLTGEECRTEGPAAPPDERELDDFAVAFVAPKGTSPCAMLVDAQGVCHEIRRNTKLGPAGGKVTRIQAEAVTVTRFESSGPDGRPVKVEVALKVGAAAAPPAWFCRAK